jgi:hypothetical protein
MENFMKVDYKWREVRDLTLIIMSLTMVHIVGFVAGLIFQPLEYIRKIDFSDIKAGVNNQQRHNEFVIDEQDEEEE